MPVRTASLRPLTILAATVLAGGLAASAVLAPRAAGDAARQAWPPFVLVAGLLLIGVVAAEDGLFTWAGRSLARVHVGDRVLFWLLLGVVAVVTVLLNLDTSVVFLTPVLIEAARTRGADERPFLYGCVFMSNAASLLLPGSNLTNLLVLAREHVPGSTFAARMAPAWAAAALVTAAFVSLVYRRELGGGRPARGAGRPARPGVLGAVGAVAATTLVVALAQPAVPVFAVGVSLAGTRVARRHMGIRPVVRAANPGTLGALLALAVCLGTLARRWTGLAEAATRAGSVASALLGALGAIAVNNLPAAMLLTARTPAHPRALLVGLNVGPNLAVTGSLSAILWMQVARRSGARPRAAVYSALGAVLVPASIVSALVALRVLAPGSL